VSEAAEAVEMVRLLHGATGTTKMTTTQAMMRVEVGGRHLKVVVVAEVVAVALAVETADLPLGALPQTAMREYAAAAVAFVGSGILSAGAIKLTRLP